jgi:hypothetical protein
MMRSRRREICSKTIELYFFSSCCIFLIRGAVLFRGWILACHAVLTGTEKKESFFNLDLDLYFYFHLTSLIYLVGWRSVMMGVVCFSIFTFINSGACLDCYQKMPHRTCGRTATVALKSGATPAARFGSANELRNHGSNCGVPQPQQLAAANQTGC